MPPCSASINCRKSEGWYLWHSALNDVVRHAFSAAHVPSWLEPTGLLHSDGKRPDGVALAPWQSGRLLVWDATCLDTFATSYRALATGGAGMVAENTEDRKAEKYRCQNFGDPPFWGPHPYADIMIKGPPSPYK